MIFCLMFFLSQFFDQNQNFSLDLQFNLYFLAKTVKQFIQLFRSDRRGAR